MHVNRHVNTHKKHILSAAQYTLLENSEHTQPLISLIDPQHVQRETTPGISGLIHIELVGYMSSSDSLYGKRMHTLMHMYVLYVHTSTYCTCVGVCSLVSAHKTHTFQT